ncbi:transcription factor bHLH140 isoform X2 [Hibiscus syriacus]|uniref:transcription factor bHLH140 isoform X2 n=1 Tax=Hibiscus syriacus TaxID=106335 RepID=UPI001921BEE9|nr:transcription factor bHLH140 isoform X2 [Hibiscus syriacus]
MLKEKSIFPVTNQRPERVLTFLITSIEGICLLARYQPTIALEACKNTPRISIINKQCLGGKLKTMEMDIDGASKPKACEQEKEKGKQIVALLVGAPASGKSTFCENVMRASSRPWVRICQDTINNGKAGSKPLCLKSAAASLKEGKSVFIDRCNLGKDQRVDFVKLGGSEVEVHAVVLDLPAKLCISRIAKRTGHEGNLQGGKAAAVVNRMLQNKELPKLSEGFSRITFCRNETDVETAVNTYAAVGPLDTLSHGCFGQKDPSAKTQLGILKFLKRPHETDTQDSVPSQPTEGNSQCGKTQETVSSSSGMANQKIKVSEDPVPGSISQDDSDVPTLAFPSISTADFQFNLEKASDIIVQKVEEFMDKLGNAKLVLVDLTERSKILSLVRAKAAEKNIDSKRFFTFVGDICQLYTKGGLRCNVIANAANWRLKPGGGGVNAAIFNAAGAALEAATMDRAKSLHPGNALVVPLPSTSPLYYKEGVTHVIHVLGPNMNPNRPNCLDNDYIKGCKVLEDAYSSLFKGFLSVANTQVSFPSSGSISSGPSKLKEDTSGTKTNSWAPCLQALYNIAMQPEKHNKQVLEASDDLVVINDMYPKAKRHLLVLARIKGLDCLADVRKEHLHLLKTMHEVGLRWTNKFLGEDASLVIRLGYHSIPSMRQLHLHVISQDFDSKCLKHKKHWNSFTTAFFRDSVDVIEEVNNHGKATILDDNKLLSMELRCHRCRSAHPNIPRLKSHISNCQDPFPAELQKKGRLVPVHTNSDIDP